MSGTDTIVALASGGGTAAVALIHAASVNT